MKRKAEIEHQFKFYEEDPNDEDSEICCEVDLVLSIVLEKNGIGQYEFHGAQGFDSGYWSITSVEVNDLISVSGGDISVQRINSCIQDFIARDKDSINETLIRKTLESLGIEA